MDSRSNAPAVRELSMTERYPSQPVKTSSPKRATETADANMSFLPIVISIVFPGLR